MNEYLLPQEELDEVGVNPHGRSHNSDMETALRVALAQLAYAEPLIRADERMRRRAQLAYPGAQLPGAQLSF